MSTHKYANLPDIDIDAPDVYETEDLPPPKTKTADDSDEDVLPTTRRSAHSKPADGTGLASKEDIDTSNLIATDEAANRFRKAEKKRNHPRRLYAYPPSPTSSPPSSPSSPSAKRPPPLAHRLRLLQAEIQSLETELADPSNPNLLKPDLETGGTGEADPGELFTGLVDVRSRLEKIRKVREGRGRLVGVVTGDLEPNSSLVSRERPTEETGEGREKEKEKAVQSSAAKTSIVEMDKRMNELEKLVGSSNAALDEVSPLPPPLLPLLTRLNSQLTLLTQPRHIDAISRRLKLLLTDLDRASASQHHAHHRRHPSQQQQGSGGTSAPAQPQVIEQLLPLLTRLGPSLPHINHVLTRLRTLSALHASAAEFQSSIEGLENEQRKVHEGLVELDHAVKTVEESLEANRVVVKGNVEGLEGRIEGLAKKLEELEK